MPRHGSYARLPALPGTSRSSPAPIFPALPDSEELGSRGGCPRTTLGSAAKAHLTLIVWRKDCRHKAEPDPAEMPQRYGGKKTVLD